jgi:hypothetical protein
VVAGAPDDKAVIVANQLSSGFSVAQFGKLRQLSVPVWTREFMMPAIKA